MSTLRHPLRFASLASVLLLAVGAAAPACSSDTGGESFGACAFPVALLLADGSASGYVRCYDGAIDRVAGVTIAEPVGDCPAAGSRCSADADCTAFPHGYCQKDSRGCDCQYGCTTDADCASTPGAVCVGPGGPSNEQGIAGACRSSNNTCRTGSDCASGECGAAAYVDGCSIGLVLACRDDADTCRAASECEDGGVVVTCAPSTRFDHPAPFSCSEHLDCQIGRPLVVDGAQRAAPPRARRDWATGDFSAVAAEVEPDLRVALAGHWARIASFEHASIASFARFTLQLLSLGAPPALLADAQRAALDEIEHARIGYALASAFGGAPVGPGDLAEAIAPAPADLEGIVRALVEEACVSETLGVAEATVAVDLAADPAMREAFARIRDDETRHAALAWSTLRWILDERAPHLRDFAARALDVAIADAHAAVPSADSLSSSAHGMFSLADTAAIRRRALNEVVLPLRAALVGPRTTAVAA